MKNELSRLIANLALMQCKDKQEAVSIVTDALVYLASGQTATEVVSQAPLPTKPTRTETPVKKALVRAGVRCSCDGCGEDVYEVSGDVFDGMSAEEFSLRFNPVSGKIKRLEPPFNIQAIDDAVLTDCPLCRKELGLLLWGKRPSVREGAKASSLESVKSLSVSDIEGLL